MRTHPRCRKCGEPITFGLKPGATEYRIIPLNLHDRAPHWNRCYQNLVSQGKVKREAYVPGGDGP